MTIIRSFDRNSKRGVTYLKFGYFGFCRVVTRIPNVDVRNSCKRRRKIGSGNFSSKSRNGGAGATGFRVSPPPRNTALQTSRLKFSVFPGHPVQRGYVYTTARTKRVTHKNRVTNANRRASEETFLFFFSFLMNTRGGHYYCSWQLGHTVDL